MLSHDLVPAVATGTVVIPRALNSAGAHLSRAVGNTPVVWIDAPFTTDGRGFWAKLEGHNPGGMKDRPALHMVARARERGELAPGGMIVESTSGTLGLGLALAGIVYGHPVTLVSDPGMEPIVGRLLRAYGARVETVERPDPIGGWQEARRRRVRDVMGRHPGAFCPDQYGNPDNVEAYATLATELAGQLGRIDVLVCSVGTGGHSSGVARVLRQYYPGLRMVGVDSSIYPGNVDYPAFDEVHWVSAAESVHTCRRLAASQYASGGWSVGAVALVAGWLARTHPADTRIAAIFPDGPQRYFDTVYNDAYCAERGLLEVAPATDPDVVAHPGEREVSRWTRCPGVVNPVLARAEGER